MPAFALAAAVSAASLNLCADEYLLLLARPEEIVSVSYLSHDRLESPLAHRARRYTANRGALEPLVALRPSIILTMGGGGRSTGMIARRFGIRTVDLRPVSSIDDVARNLSAVAAALGEPGRANGWLAAIDRLRRDRPVRALDSVFLAHGGSTFTEGSVGSEWMRLAGLAQRPLGSSVGLERLLVDPPTLFLVSDYRRGQVSRGQRWLDHPVLRRSGARRLATDGRRWTCMGPLLIGEIARLKEQLR